MENKSLSVLSLEETRQLIDIFYKSFICGLSINGLDWKLEFWNEETDIPSLLFKQRPGTIYKRFITGDYIADFPFEIYHISTAASVNEVLALSEPLNELAGAFYTEQIKGFPTLKENLPECYIPESLEMTSTPTLEGAFQNNTAIFKATYRLRYKKKGGI